MGFKATDETKDLIGEELFQLVKNARAATGQPILEEHWKELGALHQGDYMPYLDQIVSLVENQMTSAQPVEPVVTTVTVGSPAVENVEVKIESYPALAAESNVLANTDLGEGMVVSQPPPLREPESTLVPNQCPDCLKVCKNKGGLAAHRRLKHALEAVPV